MAKKRILGILIIFLILMSFSLLQAQISPEEEEKIDNAYSCLVDKVEENCASLSTEEKIFSLLAINECEAEVINDSSDEECWPFEPSGNCRLKTTAQAVLALDNVEVNTDQAQQWLLSQNRTTAELTWYLQIESNEQTTCDIAYPRFSGQIEIGEDKKISVGAGTCLSLAQDDYWLEISSVCYDQEFNISCDEDFSTTLLFKKQDSSIIHVFQQTSSAAAGGTTNEKVESFCFREGMIANPCSYQGSLWAALALDSLGEDVSSYLPYLITFAEDNQRLLPDAFLYFITGDTEYSTSLLSKQKWETYWKESADMYYDTALALFPFKDQTLLEKTNSKQWLLDVQDEDGCWLGNTRNTAFILASIWPRDFVDRDGDGDGNGLLDCVSAGKYCVNKGSCIGYEGQVLSEYYCGILSECCTVQPEQPTCAEQGGEICSSNERCSGGNMISAVDTNNCCVDGGSCQIPEEPVVSECEQQLGICRISCLSDEQQAFYSCEFSGDICCSPKTTQGKSYTWIWILLILIILVVIGIIFRDKIRDFWFRIKSKSRGKPGPKPRYGPGPPRPPDYPMRRPMPERRILPTFNQPLKRPHRSQKELDDVLKKLKGMGK